MGNAKTETIHLKIEDWQKVAAELKALRAEVRKLKKRVQELEIKESDRSSEEWRVAMGDNI